MPTKIPFIYQNSYGFKLTFNTGQDLSITTNLLLRIKSPSTTVSRDLTVTNIQDAIKGIVFYDVIVGDFTLDGLWELQLIDNTPGRFIPSDVKKLIVKKVL